MKKLFILSPHWPPINAPDMQRVRMSLPYYREHGWDPTVLAVHEDDTHAVSEPALSATCPNDIPVHKVRVDLPWLWHILGVGTLGLRALTALWRKGSSLIRCGHFDLVFVSNTQFITYAIALWWKFRFGIPYVIDLQDPWQTDYYERPGAPRPPGGWKYQFSRLLAWLLERRVYQHCSGFLSVSTNYFAALRDKYPWFQAKPQMVLHFGASNSDMETALKLPPGPHHFKKKPGEIHLLYTGAAGPIMPHALNALFHGFHHFKKLYPDKAANFRMHFYGTSYVPPGSGWPSVMPMATQYGLEDWVDEIPHRIGHLESIALQYHCDILLLLGSSDLAYSPSKLFPYYLTEKPILAVVFKDSYLSSLLLKLQCAHLAVFEPGIAVDEVDSVLENFFLWASTKTPDPLSTLRNRVDFSLHFMADELTRRQCSFFDRITAGTAG